MLDGLGFFLRVRRLWSLSYRMSPQSKMRCKAKKTVGVIRKTAARTMIISRSSFTNSNMEPKNRKQKAQAAEDAAASHLTAEERATLLALGQKLLDACRAETENFLQTTSIGD